MLVDPLRQLKAPASRHQRSRAAGLQGIELGPRLAANLQHIAKAPGGHQGRASSAALQERVGRHGGAVHHGGLGACFQVGNALQDGYRLVAGRGQQLVDADLARVIQQDKSR